MRKLVEFHVEFSGGQAYAWETEENIVVLLDGSFFTIEKEWEGWNSECWKLERILVGAKESFPSFGIARIIKRYTSRTGLSGSWTVFFDKSVNPQQIPAVRVDVGLFWRLVPPFFPYLFYNRREELFQYVNLTESEVDALPKGRIVVRNGAPWPPFFITTCPLLRACERIVRLNSEGALAVEIFPRIWKLRSGEIVEASDNEITSLDYQE